MTEWTLNQFPSFAESLAFAAVATAGGITGAPAVPVRVATRPPAAAREYALALLCVAIVTTIRAVLHSTLESASPLMIFLLPTVVMVMRNAPVPALCATVVSAGVAVRLFIEPTDPIWWMHPPQQTRLALFFAESITIVFGGWVLQRYRQQQLDVAIQAERLRAVHVTMRTVQDVMNNTMNQLQVMRIDAEGRVSTESLAIFDAAIQQTFAKLTALGSLRTYAEKPMAIGVGLDDSLS